MKYLFPPLAGVRRLKGGLAILGRLSLDPILASDFRYIFKHCFRVPAGKQKIHTAALASCPCLCPPPAPGAAPLP